MNKEIKEILRKNDIDAVSYAVIINYITNLEQENERLKTIMLEKQFPNLNCVEVKIDTYKSRIDKAIEHIKQYSNCSGSFIDDKFVIEKIEEIYNGTQLLNILTGGDEE